MDEPMIKDDELDLDDIDPTKAAIPLIDDELDDAVVEDSDTVSIDDLADAEEEEEEDMYEEEEM